MATLFGAVGGMFGMLTFFEKGNLGGHEWTIGMALVWGIVTALFVAAALGMKLNKAWKWYLQVAPPIAFFLGSSVVFLLAG